MKKGLSVQEVDYEELVVGIITVVGPLCKFVMMQISSKWFDTFL